MKQWIGAAVIAGAALVYEFVALKFDLWEWSEILFRISENKFAYGALMLFVGYTLGHAMAPHVSRFFTP